MKNNKGFAGLAIVILIATVGGIGFFHGAQTQSKKDVIGATEKQELTSKKVK